MEDSPILVAGLGNPGPEYARNRHNIGFMAIDAIALKQDCGAFTSKFHGQLAQTRIGARRVLLLKPMTYVNNSGRSVAAAARFFHIPLDRVFVIHDELDLAAGKVRLKRGGGSAGHNGVKSIDAHLGADYWRLRIGIGHPGDRRRVVGHVLDDFSTEDTVWLDPLLAALAEHLPLLIGGEVQSFMNKITLALQPAKPKPDRADSEAPDGPRGL